MLSLNDSIGLRMVSRRIQMGYTQLLADFVENVGREMGSSIGMDHCRNSIMRERVRGKKSSVIRLRASE